jgi:hypothetical protein
MAIRRLTTPVPHRATVPGATRHARCVRTSRTVAQKVYNFINVDQGLKKVKHMLDFGKVSSPHRASTPCYVFSWGSALDKEITPGDTDGLLPCC